MDKIFSKHLLKFILFGLCFCSHNLLHAQSLPATQINYSGQPIPAVKDLESLLNRYKAGIITINKTQLENRTGQEFYLSIEGSHSEIIYTTLNSLENAVYTYLDILGFRWYGPGELWFVQPKSIARDNLKGQWYAPSFRNRQFFGTGGLDFGTAPTFDLANNYKQEWYEYKRRNRFNADFEGAGHMGSAFYLSNKYILDQHPEWFADSEGKKKGRIKIEKDAAVTLFKQYIKPPGKNVTREFTLINVEPEDGRGEADDPLPPNGFKGIKKWNSADKWWWLANEVSKDYDEDDKSTVISMYAYGNGKENALAPSFNLRKNIYPVLIPYAFQKAYLPEEMITTWAEKVNGNMGIYDYWNITQWSEGLPQFNIFSIPRKLKFWNAHKINGVYLETTDAFGPMGPALWIAGQLQWNLNKNFNELYDQFFRDCFGAAEAPVKNMYTRWSLDYQGAAEVSFSLQDLKNASSLVPSHSKEAMRINQLKAYVHYMKLYYEHDGSVESRNQIFKYLYSIHHLRLVQTSAFIGQQYIRPGGLAADPGKTKPLQLADIEKQFQSDVKDAGKPYQLSRFNFDFSKIKYVEPIPEQSWLYGRFQCNFFFYSPFTGDFKMETGTQMSADLKIISNNKTIRSIDLGPDQFEFKVSPVPGKTWFMKKISFPVVKGNMYQIQSSGGFSRIVLKSAGVVLFKNPGAQDFDNYQYPTQYFYVPKNTSEIIFTDAEPEGTNGRGYLVAPDGTVMRREKTGALNIYKVKVNPTWAGKTWAADFGHPSWSFKNIPNITSLQKFSYLE